MRIGKIDYFAGVFMTTILQSVKTTPMYCEATDDSRRAEFETDTGKFNVFIKYSTARKVGWDYDCTPKKKSVYWNLTFQDAHYNYLRNHFHVAGKRNLVVIVCTDANMKETRIAILQLDEALLCLSTSTSSGTRRITVSRTGGEHSFSCYGVNNAGIDKNIQPFVNHMRFFDEDSNDE